MRLATASVGLVSPRSTCESIGALTPLRSARSRSDRSIASRRARTRGPMWICDSSWSMSAMRARTLSRTSVCRAAKRPGGMASLRRVAEFLRPDVLVLAGGGIVGEAWMQGLLAGIEDASGLDLREAEAFVGTSAGSIVAARLAAGRRPARPKDGAPADLPGEEVQAD